MPYTNSSGKQCVVFGCTNNQKKLYNWQQTGCEIHVGQSHKDCPCLQIYKLHYIPKDADVRRSWLKAINRKDFNPKTEAVVCSIHFVDGRPSKQNPLPTLNMGFDCQPTTPARRPLVRRSLPLKTPTSTTNINTLDATEASEEILTATPLQSLENIENSVNGHGSTQCNAICCHKYPKLCLNKPLTTETSTQTIDLVALDHSYCYSKKTREMSTQCNSTEFSVDDITKDSDCQFYTGLTFSVFMTLIGVLKSFGKDLPYKLSVSNQILLVLIRLRLALTFKDIGRGFNISHQLASNIFHTWIDIMSKELSTMISWLPREVIRDTLPDSFHASFPRTTCIIDCSEVFIQRPFSLKARSQTWSTYKSHNTAKFLVAIAPSGYIMYISPLYGGRASDNFITKDCGFLDFLLPGDEVMADRGFTIGEELTAKRVKLNIPAFMKGRKQLTEEETIQSRRIAAERIHVERAIMRLKSYRILSTTLGIKTLKKGNKHLKVIGALCNMRGVLIKDVECRE